MKELDRKSELASSKLGLVVSTCPIQCHTDWAGIFDSVVSSFRVITPTVPKPGFGRSYFSGSHTHPMGQFNSVVLVYREATPVQTISPIQSTVLYSGCLTHLTLFVHPILLISGHRTRTARLIRMPHPISSEFRFGRSHFSGSHAYCANIRIRSFSFFGKPHPPDRPIQFGRFYLSGRPSYPLICIVWSTHSPCSYRQIKRPSKISHARLILVATFTASTWSDFIIVGLLFSEQLVKYQLLFGRLNQVSTSVVFYLVWFGLVWYGLLHPVERFIWSAQFIQHGWHFRSRKGPSCLWWVVFWRKFFIVIIFYQV